MAIKFTSKGSIFNNVGTFLSASTGSKLRVFMECKVCYAHSELPQNGDIKCPCCGSDNAERLDMSVDMPDWFNVKIR